MKIKKVKKKTAIICLLCIISLNFFIFCQKMPEDNKVIKTESGLVKGVLADKESNLVVFKGIPYAMPPVGDLRWKAPKASNKWEGIRVCDTLGNICPQIETYGKIKNMCEDCLYLNVFTTNINKKKKLPVMVWIHGGGLNMGTGFKQNSDGSEFAKKGVVLVSFNYRLGQLGFLAHPELSAESENGVSGNYGFLDQIAALKWVKQNIEAFGGDPNNVTIFGESAGGTSVSVLCSSKLAKGLFHKAIMQSPWMFGFMSNTAKPNITYLKKNLASITSAEALGEEWAKKYLDKDDKDVMTKLRSLDANLITRDESYYETRTTIDGWVLNDYPESVFTKGEQADVPMIIGTNSNEGNFYWNYIKQKSKQDFIKSLTNFYGNEAINVVNFYTQNSEQNIKIAVSKYITDSWFLEPSMQMLKGMEKIKSPIFQYEFSVPNRKYPKLGAIHGAEIKYVFNNLEGEILEIDRSISKTMMDYWVQFAKSGNPNKKGLNNWSVYSSEMENYMDFSEKHIKMQNKNNISRLDTIHKLKVKAYTNPKSN